MAQQNKNVALGGILLSLVGVGVIAVSIVALAGGFDVDAEAAAAGAALSGGADGGTSAAAITDTVRKSANEPSSGCTSGSCLPQNTELANMGGINPHASLTESARDVPTAGVGDGSRLYTINEDEDPVAISSYGFMPTGYNAYPCDSDPGPAPTTGTKYDIQIGSPFTWSYNYDWATQVAWYNAGGARASYGLTSGACRYCTRANMWNLLNCYDPWARPPTPESTPMPYTGPSSELGSSMSSDRSSVDGGACGTPNMCDAICNSHGGCYYNPAGCRDKTCGPNSCCCCTTVVEG